MINLAGVGMRAGAGGWFDARYEDQIFCNQQYSTVHEESIPEEPDIWQKQVKSV